MFAQIKGDYSVNEKLREIDVANENVHGSTDYTGKVSFFKCSAAFERITGFLAALNRAAQGRSLTEMSGKTAKEAEDPGATPKGIVALQRMLEQIEALIEQAPPAARNANADPDSDSSAAPSSRFGSPAFRSFLDLMEARAPQLLGDVLRAAGRGEGSGVESLMSAQQNEESKQWEREGHETLREYRRNNSKHSHSHHNPHKLPPHVVISHGPTGVNNYTPPHATEAKESTEEADDKEPSDTAAISSDASTTSAFQQVLFHLTRYLLQCWGDKRRLDYGTGHELNFMCLLYALGQCGVFDLEDAEGVAGQRLIACVFARYVALQRRLLTTYWLEPAGSRGVWGLDDYSFLPFLFGSAQLMKHRHIKPKSVRYPEILDGFSSEYLYLDSIRFIMGVKTCSFAEHSPMLNDITIIKTWEQVNAGLWRMYLAEVLGKFAVVQHFIYSPLLPKWPVQPLQVEEVKKEDPCCSDAIHFPSSIGAKQAQS